MPVEERPYLSTAEVAELLQLNEKKIYALAAAGKLPTVRLSGKWLFPRELLLAHLRRLTRVPDTGLLERLLPDLLVVAGSDDLLFRAVIHEAGRRAGQHVACSVLGTSGGLRLLAAGQVHAATAHFPVGGGPTSAGPEPGGALITLFRRQQGWMARPASTPPVHEAAEVVERGLRFARREPDCGTDALARHLFAEAGCPLDGLASCAGPYLTHLDAALAVASGEAEVGLGIRDAAQRCGLTFTPQADEDFYLALPARFLGEPRVLQLIDILLDCIRSAPPLLAASYDRRATGAFRALPATGPVAGA